VEPIGETNPIHIQIGSKEDGAFCVLKLIVMAHDTHDILLGLDWFNITGASINPSTNSLRFSSKTFYLNSATIIPDAVLNTVTDKSK
jgi:hypothetical protein